MAKTKISWSEFTWNVCTGCTKISAGCAHCYAEVMARRLKAMGVEKYRNGFQLTLHPGALKDPMKVKNPSMFFVCSMADLFHKDVPFDFIDKVMEVIEATPQHTYQLLTKRADRMFDYFINHKKGEVPKNTWLGVTVENDFVAERADILVGIENAPVRFLSVEPMLGYLDLVNLNGIDWVICGGESGMKARPIRKEWVLHLQRRCAEQDVPFFFKQWGTYGEDGVKRDKKANGCTIDGVVYQEWPKAQEGAK